MEMERDVKSVMKYWMEGEISKFIKLCILVHISLCYCYFAAKVVPKGGPRLFSFLPVVCFFFLIPLNLQSIHLGGTTGFFLSWLANFKLLLLAFGRGPLSTPSISLPRFLALACLPINIQKNNTEPRAQSSHNGHFQETPNSKSAKNGQTRDYQENPNPKSLEKCYLYPQNGPFQENPNPKSLKKSGLYPKNGSIRRNPYPKSTKSGHTRDFQENPNPKSLEKCDLYPNNGSFRRNSYPKSTKSSHTRDFQENPNPKSLEKCDLYPQNGSSKGNPYPKSTKKGNTRDFQENPNPKSLKKCDLFPQKGSSKENPYPKSTKNGKMNASQQNGHVFELPKNLKKFVTYAIKAFLLGLMIGVYSFSEYMHPTIILLTYFIHIYFYLEIIQAIVAAVTRGLLGLELEPQFKEPYFSTSLQDFWGGRWNLMVNRILRPTVYNPVLHFSAKLVGRKFAVYPAVVSTFAVSGLMHEVMFYYLGRVRPTWEITWFFVLHGTCLAVEIAVKKAVNGRYQPPRFLAAILSVGFVLVTGFWLFFPQLLRCQALPKAFAEYDNLTSFFKDVRGVMTSAFEVFYT